MLRASPQAPPKRLIGDYCGAERFRRAHPVRCAQSIVVGQPGPESKKFSVIMDSGFAPSARPGMTAD
jgi:hypothetical protein